MLLNVQVKQFIKINVIDQRVYVANAAPCQVKQTLMVASHNVYTWSPVCVEV